MQPATCYSADMTRFTDTFTLALLLTACHSEDPGPAPHSRQIAEQCDEERSGPDELCAEGLVCNGSASLCSLGFCAPACESDDDCPSVDGATPDCQTDTHKCGWLCDVDSDCPSVDPPLRCWSGALCIAGPESVDQCEAWPEGD